MTTNHKKRIEDLERSTPATLTPEVRAYGERLAREYNIPVDEIFAEAERLLHRFGPDAPIERVAAGIAVDLGIPVEELMDDARDILTATGEPFDGNRA